MPKSPEVGTRPWSSVHLNAIRGAAALIVLLGHTRSLFFSSITANGGPTQAANYVARGNRATVGEEAVIIFFVLSGYLVGGSVLRSVKNGTWSWTDYLFKRITRLWVVLLPALAFGLALDVLGMHLFGSAASIYAGPATSLVPHDLSARLTWKVIAANAFFLQGILSPTAGTNNSLWSLAYEWWYYLQFPLLILAFSKGSKPFIRVLYLGLLLGSAFFVGNDIMTLFPCWLLGAAIATIPVRKLSRSFAIPSLAFSISALCLVKMFDLSKYGAAWCAAIACALILFCAVRQPGRCSNVLYQRVAGFFSDISYTLYLIHLPLAIFICALVNRPWHYYSVSLPNIITFLLMNAVLVVAAYVFYGIFEGNTDRVRRALTYKTRKTGIFTYSDENRRSKRGVDEHLLVPNESQSHTGPSRLRAQGSLD
jgi:peptidoglycan/LPS O-acetylase OafA/YrhL